MTFTPQSTATVVPSKLVNDRDHGALVTVTAALCMVFSLLFGIARLFARWPWKGSLRRDDAVTGAALFFSVTQSILVLADVQAGFGKTKDDISSQAAIGVLRVQYASDIMFVISLCLGRLAVALLFVRLSDRGPYGHRTRLRGALIITLACILYGFASFLIIAIRHPSVIKPGLFGRWIAIAAMGDVLDIILVLFPFAFVSSPRISRSTKFTVIIGFGMRLLLIPLSTLRLTSLSRAIPDPDYTLALADAEIWTQFEIHYNVVAATIPCLRPFLRAFYTEQLTKMVSIDDDP